MNLEEETETTFGRLKTIHFQSTNAHIREQIHEQFRQLIL